MSEHFHFVYGERDLTKYLLVAVAVGVAGEMSSTDNCCPTRIHGITLCLVYTAAPAGDITGCFVVVTALNRKPPPPVCRVSI